MTQFQHVIQSQVGLHGRPATLLVKTARTLDSRVTIEKDGKTASATGIIALMTLGAGRGDTVTVRIEGGDEAAAVQTLKKFFQEHL